MTEARLLHELLQRIGTLLRAEERRIADTQALYPVHLHALHYLGRANRFSDTTGAVTEYLGLTKGTVSQSLSVLKRRGMIAAHTDPNDRRVTHLHITDKGRRFLSDARSPPLWTQALQELDPGDQQSLVDALTGLLRALQRANASRTFGVCQSCRHLRSEADSAHHCGLTGEPLSPADLDRICREHEPGRS